MDDALQKEILLQLANTLPYSIIQIVISYKYKFLNKEYTINYNDIDQVVDLGKDKIALITRKYEILVYNVGTNNLLYTLPLVNNLLDLHLTMLSSDKMIIGYLSYESGNSYSEIKDSNTGVTEQYIPGIAINNSIVLCDKIVVLLKSNFTIKHIPHNISNCNIRRNSLLTDMIDGNNFVVTFGSNLNFYNSKSIIPYYSYCYNPNVECSFPVVLSNDTILYYLFYMDILIWFNYESRKVVSTLNVGSSYITQIYKISETTGIIILGYTSCYNRMYLCDLNTGEKFIKYEAKEVEGPICILGTLPDETIVSSRGNNIVINSINGSCNYNINSSQFSYKSVVLEDGKIVFFKPQIGYITILY